MSRRGQQPAELATVIAEAAGFGGPSVAFEITHRTRDQIAAPLALPSSSLWPGICRETLAFDLPPAGFRVHTGFAASPASTMAGLGSLDGKSSAGGFSYQGTASLNPRFLYDSARDHEFLFSVGERPWVLDHTDSLLLTKVLAELAGAAAAEQTRAPILLLQSPVAPFRSWPNWPENKAGEPPKISRGAAVRFSVGVDTDNSGGRLALTEAAVDVARRSGLCLHLADRRVGRVRGDWKQAVEYDADVYAHRRTLIERGLADGPGDGSVRQAFLVTFVGPARVGSSASILNELARSDVGVLAIAVASLQELAFINVVVAVPPSADGLRRTARGRVLPVKEGIQWLVGQCGRSGEPAGLPHATDYQVCLTGPLPWRVETDPAPHPLWLQWQTHVADHSSLTVVDDVVFELMCSEIVADVQLDYCRSRMVGDGRICSAKVSVTLTTEIADAQLPDRLSALCRATQANVEWKRSHQAPDGHSIGLKVAWRERWLGRVKSTGVA